MNVPARVPERSAEPKPERAPDRPPEKPLSGPQRALQRLGLVRDIDLVLHLPLRYEDETRLQTVASLRDGESAQVEVVVQECRIEARNRRQLLVRVADDTGSLTLRFLNFYASHQKTLAVGQRVRVRGEPRIGLHGLGCEMMHPVFKAVVAGAPMPSALTPVYPSNAQLPQAYLRKVVASAVARTALDELVPPPLLPTGLPSLKEAVRWLHQPPADVPLDALGNPTHPAWQRLKFDELLAQQLAQAQAHQARAKLRAPVLADPPNGPNGPKKPPSPNLHDRLLAALPFSLTAAQARVNREIAADLARSQPMHRLLQGDVGSGKTVIAALAATRAMGAGWQCALMAPTEILAEQHFRKLVQWLEPLGITVAWLTGSRKGKARAAMIAQVASGEAALVVGTHAVIQDDVRFARLGLAVVDEQHRFGVAQRLALRAKLGAQSGPPSAPSPAGLEPHLLMMSATPIPRTLAMSYFADLDVSTIDELPPGRTPIVTKIFADNRREAVIARIQGEVARGRQVYWVCPLIDEMEPLPEDTAAKSPGARAPLDLQSATETHAQLTAALPGYRVGLLHGRMPGREKAAVMEPFTRGETAVLVATTVIEVGVDVPNASLMVIEHAERFGLSQLHQLRGRVGRGAVASVCVLIYTPPLSPTGKDRLQAMVQTTDGFEIARRDLEIRGPGEFMGARQSGDALLRFADLAQDGALLHQARDCARAMLAAHPQAARAQVDRWLGGKAEFLKA